MQELKERFLTYECCDIIDIIDIIDNSTRVVAEFGCRINIDVITYSYILEISWDVLLHMTSTSRIPKRTSGMYFIDIPEAIQNRSATHLRSKVFNSSLRLRFHMYLDP